MNAEAIKKRRNCNNERVYKDLTEASSKEVIWIMCQYPCTSKYL